MIDKILNGLGDSSSSRSGSSSSSRNDTAQTYTVSTPSGVYSNLTLEQYNKVKQALADYNTAYGIAYSYNVSAPSWTDFNGDNGKELIDAVVIKAINSGNTSKSESWAKEAETRAAALSLQQESTSAKIIQKLIEDGIATPIDKELLEKYPMVDGSGLADFERERKQREQEQPAQNINIPEPTNVQTLPPTTDGDKKEKGSSLLIPGIILAIGIFGAIMLTSKSKRR